MAGLVTAILLTARFWAVGSLRRAILIPPRDLARLVLAIALTAAVAYPFDRLTAQALPTVVAAVGHLVAALLQAGLMVFVVVALFGDRTVTLRTAFTQRWPTALVLAVAALAAFLPGQLLHAFDHKLALGQPAAVVWALMMWDSLVVGLIATLTGAALWASYRSGATWHGWGADFLSPPAPAVIEQLPMETVAAAPQRRRRRPGPRPRPLD